MPSDDEQCALCGKNPAAGFATVTVLLADRDYEVVRLCHDGPDPMTCYHRWTVYGERPTLAELIERMRLPMPDLTPTDRPDPVTVEVCWQAMCTDCGWHTPPTSPKSWVVTMANQHRAKCPQQKEEP